MIKTVDVLQIQKLDQAAIERIGIPSIVLMENAGRQVAQEVIRRVRRKMKPFVCIFCGMGNNAGDGLVAARHLVHTGIKTKVFLIGEGKGLKADAQVNYRVLRNCHFSIHEIQSVTRPVFKDMKRCDVVIDAIFGVGLNRDVQEPFKGIIQSINQHASYVVSVDVPSGLNASSGDIYGVCVRADKTVTFTLPKKGFYKSDGPHHTGKVVVVDIGIPLEVLRKYGGFK